MAQTVTIMAQSRPNMTQSMAQSFAKYDELYAQSWPNKIQQRLNAAFGWVKSDSVENGHM